MKLSQKARQLFPSEPRRVYDEAQKFTDVIDLTLGDPDLPPPRNIREAGSRAFLDGDSRYSANAGLIELRRAISDETRRECGIGFDPETEVIVTAGAMEAAYLALWSLLDPGSEAIIPSPHWINYGEVVRSFGAAPRFVMTRPEDRFVVRPEEVEGCISPKTRLLILNTPSNPTGIVIPGGTLDRLAEIAVKHDLAVISDEIYDHLVYDGRKAESILTRPGMRERTVVISGFSKRFAMTGYRVGWAVGPEELIRVMTQMTENIVECAPLPSQYAAIEALSGRTDGSYIRREFEKRRNCVLEELGTIPQLRCPGIDATFYGFIDVSGTGMDGETFVSELLRSKRVALIPGAAYGGAAYRDFVRIAFTVDCGKLHAAFARIREFLRERASSGR